MSEGSIGDMAQDPRVDEAADSPEAHELNSQAYWERRFATDWEQAGGPQQSWSFMAALLACLPAALDAQIAGEGLSLLDCGCAEGSGTAVLAERYPRSHVAGFDWSLGAVAHARARHARCEFFVADFASCDRRADVLVCSNCLEHLADPLAALERFTQLARHAVVVLVPYCEQWPLHPEHTRAFDASTLPRQLAAWSLRARTLLPVLPEWPGRQLLLTYAPAAPSEPELQPLPGFLELANQACLDRIQLPMEALRGESERLAQLVPELRERVDRLTQDQARLHAELAAAAIEHERLARELAGAAAQAEERRAELETIYRSKLWRGGQAYRRVRHALERRFARTRVSVGAFLRKTAPRANRGSAYDIVRFPIIDWDFRFQRPQQMALRLAARGHRVFYLHLAPRPSGEPYALRPLASGVWEVSVAASGAGPARGPLSPAETAEWLLGLARLRRDCELGATLAIVDQPFWLPLVESASERFGWPLVYDCMDDHAGFSTNAPEVTLLEERLMRSARLVVTASRRLEERARRLADRVARVPNACDYEHFSRVPARTPGERPVIGYYGAIAEWFDAALVAQLAGRRPDWDFVLVGSTFSGDTSVLSQLPNVTLPGERPYAELPDWLARWDALILPFKRTPLTEATNPVKLYEILAAGKPLVSVPLPEIVAERAPVRLAETAADFEVQLEDLLRADDQREVRRAFARRQRWETRLDALEPALRTAFPKVSIVIVTFNNLELTRLCFESLAACADWPHCEIVVVDNASSDGTQAWLADLQAGNPHVRLLLNETNRGFAAANNQGLQLATGDGLVLLNNDTVVTRGWLARLVAHLGADAGLGLVGAVTNAIGNEARVAQGYTKLADLPNWAAAQARAHNGELLPIPVLAMFCLAMRRETYERIGPLDERFDVGFFEDDDYSRRARELRLEVACARDVFVHHWHGAGFDLLGADVSRRLFEANRSRYEAKWGETWHAHRDSGTPTLTAVQRPARPTVPKPFEGWASRQGHCNVCGQRTRFYFASKAGLRESLFCAACRTTSRYRSLARGVLVALRQLAGVEAASLAELREHSSSRDLRVYDTQVPFYFDGGAYPLSDYLTACAGLEVTTSFYGRPPAPARPRTLHADLQRLPFRDQSFDLVLTSDVMEHVRLDGQAHAEIRRVLRPGGVYLFTVPHVRAGVTTERVRVVDPADPSRDVLLAPREEHGDANSLEGTALCYRLYGPDLDDRLRALGFEVEYARDDFPENGIHETELFFCRVPADERAAGTTA